MLIGRIKSVNPTRLVADPLTGALIRKDGYCFITSEERLPDGTIVGIDRFAHRTELAAGMELSPSLIGLYVEFQPALHPLGPRALSVRLMINTPSTWAEHSAAGK